MARLTLYRAGYVAALALLAGCVWWAAQHFALGPLGLLAIGAGLLLPGRIQGHLYREFFRGTRLFRENRPEEAIPHLERFAEKIARRPGLKRAIWLSWPGYSGDVEAMTYTNLGASRLGTGDLDGSERDLQRAVQIDPRSPMPWLNLALLHTVCGETEAAHAAAERARLLGYTGGVLDQLQRAGAGLLTAMEGRG
jgi:tetratricopeptide (TPR) repeat protein